MAIEHLAARRMAGSERKNASRISGSVNKTSGLDCTAPMYDSRGVRAARAHRSAQSSSTYLCWVPAFGLLWPQQGSPNMLPNRQTERSGCLTTCCQRRSRCTCTAKLGGVTLKHAKCCCIGERLERMRAITSPPQEHLTSEKGSLRIKRVFHTFGQNKGTEAGNEGTDDHAIENQTLPPIVTSRSPKTTQDSISSSGCMQTESLFFRQCAVVLKPGAQVASQTNDFARNGQSKAISSTHMLREPRPANLSRLSCFAVFCTMLTGRKAADRARDCAVLEATNWGISATNRVRARSSAYADKETSTGRCA